MITKCLFPAAGYGTRFLPATKSIPKEMLPILTKPLIQYAVEEAYEAGCTTMATVTGRGKHAIADHFDISYEVETEIGGTPKDKLLCSVRSLMKNCTFTYTPQNQMKGLGDAIYKGKSLVGGLDPFAVILADDLCVNNDGEGVLTQMMKVYKKYKCSVVAIMEVPQERVSSYGVIAGTEIEDGIFRIETMVEKPDIADAPSNLAIIGRYILTPDIFELLKDTQPGKGGEIQITDALLEQAKIGKVVGFKFEGKRFDCGSIDGYVEATNYFYNNMKEMESKTANC